MADQMVESAADVVRVARAGAADMISLKLTKMGGVAECVRVAHVCAAVGIGVHLGGCAAPGIVDSALTRLALSTPDIDVFAEVGESAALVDDQVAGVVHIGPYARSDGHPGLGGMPPALSA
jgi:L-alanine-DL-glutamate epimerase-like enolase superfamily enzyme